MQTVEVRAATATDASAIQAIFAAGVATADWLPTQARTALDFAHSSANEVVHVAVAHNGEVLGFVSVQPCEAFVHHIYVHADAQRRGVGRLLLASLESWLRVPWRLKCVRANQRACAFYIALGWREVATGESEHGPYVVLEWLPMSQRPDSSVARTPKKRRLADATPAKYQRAQ